MDLKGMRKERGLTQQALADLSGIHIRTLQAYEKGLSKLSNMTVKNAVSLAKVLEVPIEAFLEEEQEEPRT